MKLIRRIGLLAVVFCAFYGFASKVFPASGDCPGTTTDCVGWGAYQNPFKSIPEWDNYCCVAGSALEFTSGPPIDEKFYISSNVGCGVLTYIRDDGSCGERILAQTRCAPYVATTNCNPD